MWRATHSRLAGRDPPPRGWVTTRARPSKMSRPSISPSQRLRGAARFIQNRVAGESFAAFDHRKQHLEALNSLQGVGVIGGHDDAVASFQAVRRPVNTDLGLAIEDLHKGIEIRGVFSQALAFVKGEKGDVSSAVDGDLLAND